MDTEAKPSDGDLFYESLIQSYVNAPRFVERPWLAKQIEEKLAEPDCRFLLLTAEPGAGKTAFMAWLAHQHPDWCRYFIRREQRTPLGDVGAHSFLLQVGFQLAAIHPDLFQRDQLKIMVQQRIGTMDATSEAVGAEIDKLFTSPFYQKVIQIQQEVNCNQGNVTGIRIREGYADNRSLPIENLQYWALIDPALALRQLDPNQRIVVLVDALDELRYRDAEKSLLKWLADCPELPSNLRFILTSRPDDALLNNFRGSQQPWLHQMAIKEEVFEEDFMVQEHLSTKVREDLSSYAGSLVKMSEVEIALKENNQAVDSFVERIVNKANGNFGYLDAIGRAVDTAILQNQQDLLKEILKLSELPDTLKDLYAFFLGKIKDVVAKEMVPVESIEGEVGFVPVWPAVYKPILGILSVAREPLTPTQIQKLGSIQAEFDYVTVALEKLRQFLDRLGNSYRFYHSTLPEFFTSPQTKERTDYSYYYVDTIKQNQSIVNYYRGKANSWAQVNLRGIDVYGLRYLAQHLEEADRGDELHELLAVETSVRHHAWFEVKDRIGDAVGFLKDVSLAWKLADDSFENIRKISGDVCDEVLLGKIFGLQSRYALITSSINSMAGNLPPKLLGKLLEKKIWKEPSQGLAYARQIPDPEQRAQSLMELISYFSGKMKDEVLSEALAAAQAIKDPYWRAGAIIKLAPKLPKFLLKQLLQESLPTAQAIEDMYSKGIAPAEVELYHVEPLKEDQLREALAAIKLMKNEAEKVEELTKLIPHLPKPLLQESLAIAIAIQGELQRTLALSRLAPRLVELDSTKELMSSAQTIAYTHRRTVALARLIPNLSEHVEIDALKQDLETVKLIGDLHWRAESLTEIAPYLPVEIQKKVLQKALATAQKIGDERWLAHVLSALAICMAKSNFLSDAIDLVQTIQGERWKVEALIKLASHLHGDSNDKVLKKAISAICKIENEQWQAETLVKFPHLPEPLLREAEVLTRQIVDEFWRTRVMIWLAPQLPESLKKNLVQEALTTAQQIKNEHKRIVALVKLSPQLPEPLLQKVLQATKEISDKDDRAQLLAKLASCFAKLNYPSKALEIGHGITDEYWYTEVLVEVSMCLVKSGNLREAFKTAKAIAYEHLQILTLAKLTPYLPVKLKDRTLRKLLAKTQSIVAHNERARILVKLAPYLPKSFLQEAILMAHAIKDEDCRNAELVGLITHLAKSGDSWEAHIAIKKELTDSYWKALAIANLFFYLPENLKDNLLQEALEELQAVTDGDKLAEVLSKLVPLGDNFQTSKFYFHLYPCWYKALRLLSLGSRQKLLVALQNLLPIPTGIAGTQGVMQIVYSVQNVERWWP
jgi:hypothetical protein